jgi:DNA invertase Pin-like site-specific DNA recombinase
MDNRPGLNAALDRLRNGEAVALVVLKLDRLSRSTRDVLELTDAIQKNGWELHSISEKLDTGSAAGRFVLTILAALAEMERERISERTRFALNHKRSQGERPGTTPYGFETTEDGRLVPVRAEQETLAYIAELRREGTAYATIAEHLNAEGVRTKRGKRWYASTVASLIKKVIPRHGRPRWLLEALFSYIKRPLLVHCAITCCMS